MDDNTKEVLILLITTISTVAIAWIKVRSITKKAEADAQPQPQHYPAPPPPPPSVPPPTESLPPEEPPSEPRV